MATTDEMNIMNTRVAMKTDLSSNWESSTKQLLKGEIALCKLDGNLSDMYEMRIGVGDKTWKELSGSNIRIPASCVTGLEEAIASLSTSFYREAAFEDLPTTGVTNGSIAVVEKTINAEKQLVERTAYVWNSANTEANKWEALDGNYSAENVYFTNDLTCAGSYTQVGNINKTVTGTTTIEAAGKSVKDVFTKIFTKAESGTTTNPSVSINTAGPTTVEYKSTQTPHYSFTFNKGSYSYGPDDTGVTRTSNWTIKTNGNTLTGTGNDATIKDTDGGVACNPATFKIDSTGNQYKIEASISHSAGVTPKNNLGEDDPTESKKIAAGTKTNNKFLFNGVKPSFIMFSSGNSTAPTTIDSSDITDTNAGGGTITIAKADTWYKILNDTLPTKINITGGKYQNLYFVSYTTKSSWSGKTSDNVNVLNTPAATSVTTTYVDGTTDATYKCFSVTNAGVFSDTACNMTWNN